MRYHRGDVIENPPEALISANIVQKVEEDPLNITNGLLTDDSCHIEVSNN